MFFGYFLGLLGGILGMFSEYLDGILGGGSGFWSPKV